MRSNGRRRAGARSSRGGSAFTRRGSSCRRGGGRSPQGSQNPGVRRFLCVVLIPRAGSALSRESTRNPGVLVSPIPDGDAHTAAGVHTGADSVAVVRRLLGEQSIGGGECHSDIELGNGNFHAQSGV